MPDAGSRTSAAAHRSDTGPPYRATRPRRRRTRPARGPSSRRRVRRPRARARRARPSRRPAGCRRPRPRARAPPSPRTSRKVWLSVTPSTSTCGAAGSPATNPRYCGVDATVEAHRGQRLRAAPSTSVSDGLQRVPGRELAPGAAGPGARWSPCSEYAAPRTQSAAHPAGDDQPGSRPAKPRARSKAGASSGTSTTGPKSPSRAATRCPGSVDRAGEPSTAATFAGAQAND